MLLTLPAVLAGALVAFGVLVAFGRPASWRLYAQCAAGAVVVLVLMVILAVCGPWIDLPN